MTERCTVVEGAEGGRRERDHFPKVDDGTRRGKRNASFDRNSSQRDTVTKEQSGRGGKAT